jgi:hypothetical protein
MPIDITNSKTPITTDDDFFVSVNPRYPVVVSIAFSTGTGGSFAILNSQGKAYRNEDNSANLAIDFNDTITAFNIDATGGHINLTTTGMVAGSASALVVVTQQKNAG